MDKGKKTILIILSLIVAMLLVIAFILSQQEQDKPTTDNPSNNPSGVVGKEFTKVNDYDDFFSIQKAINDNINFNSSFIAEEMYANNGSTKYYFINGIILENNMVYNTSSYQSSVNYLVIIDANNNYEINKLESNIDDLQGYANAYNIQNKQVSSGKKFQNISISDESLLSTYIEYFKNLLINDSSKAYDMLSEDTKNKYNDLVTFSNQKYDIYDLLSSIIFGYAKKGDKEITYYIEDNKRNKITIYENNVMNFKISY